MTALKPNIDKIVLPTNRLFRLQRGVLLLTQMEYQRYEKIQPVLVSHNHSKKRISNWDRHAIFPPKRLLRHRYPRGVI